MVRFKVREDFCECGVSLEYVNIPKLLFKVQLKIQIPVLLCRATGPIQYLEQRQRA